MLLPDHRLVSLGALACALVFAPAAAAAQEGAPAIGQAEGEAEVDAGADDTAGEGIVVIGNRQRGQVQTDQVPILELEEADIASYGADSIADLIAQLSPQVSSGRGRGDGAPVVLVNGQRIGGFRELRGYPPEAISKVEVLPEEVALQFGFAANQRVINFILKDDFKSREVEVEYGGPFDGGTANGEIEVSQLSIDGPRRVNIGAQYTTSSLLTEAERAIEQTPGSVPSVATDADPAAFRSLRADAESYELEASLNSAIGEGANATAYSINANVTRDHSRSLSGLDTVILTGPGGESAIRTLDADPLERLSTTTTVSGGGSLRGSLGAWQGNLTVDGVVTDGETLIDRRRDTAALVDAAADGTLALDGPLPAVPGAGFDRSDSRTYTTTTKATLNGNPLTLPAGEVSATFDAGFDWRRIESEDTRSNTPVDLTRRRLSTGANLNIPIAERGGAWGAVGDLSLNLNAGLEDLSDFGLLGDYTVGLTWGPTERLRLSASYIHAEQAPSLTDLGGAQITTFNVPVYDFLTGQSVLATIVSGGNPDLLAETQRDIKLAANYELDLFDRANLVVEYFENSSDNVTQGFPLLTSAIEAAFPERVTRDASGRLLAIDQRPVTFAERNSSRLRYGFNVAGKVGKAPPEREARGGEGGSGERTSGRRGGGGGGGFRGGGGRGFGGGGDGQGRWQLGVYHSIEFDNTALVADGGPLLDLLGGDALSGGGVPRHQIEVEGGVFHKGIGLRLNGNYQSATRVDGSGLPGSQDLFFGDIARFNLRLFANLEQQKWLTGDQPGFWKGTRLSLRMNNLFDAQQRVTNQDGVVPLSYQPDLLDPLGRTFEIEFRKLF